MKHFYFLFLLFSALTFGQLSPPDELQDYYSDVNFNNSGPDLYQDLAANIIANHTNFLSYSQRHQFLYDADQDPNNSDNVILIYSGDSRYKLEYLSSSNSYSPQTFNTEHVYPRSLVDNTAEADLHHLRTCDIDVNSDRGNLPFVDGSGNYSEEVDGWYPGDEWRGDVARMIMYMNLRYDESFNSVGDLNLFLEWNAEDPVSEIEIQRNNVISGAQGNRNPFIDNPYLATLIWSGPTADNRWATLSSPQFVSSYFKIYPNPVTAGYFYMDTPKSGMVIIHDVLGKTVARLETTSGKNKINIPNLKNGVYILKFNGQGKTFTKKLVIR